MKRYVLITILSIVCLQELFATHIIGGEMRYEYIGPGVAPNSKLYKIRLLLLKGDSPTGASLISQYIVGVFNNDDGGKVIGPAANNNWAAVEDFSGTQPVPIIVSPCIQNPPSLLYVYKTYSFTIELVNNNLGYTVAFQTFSRQNSNNVNNNEGATYTCVVPGLNTLPMPLIDNSPSYKLPISVICENSTFTLDFSATDPDGDSLVYNFCNAYNGGLADQGDYQNPVGPPYGSVVYTGGYNASFPMGPLVTINSHTGIISGTAPPAGKYVICVCTSVYRNGNLIGVHRKDLIVAVNGCIPLAASSDFTPVTCDGFTVNFTNNSTGNPDTFTWDFGDPASGAANISNLPNPTHTFTAAGIFNIKLVVSLAGQCADSVTKPIGVYPGFLPGFITSPTLCAGSAVHFTDTTYTAYGVVDSWRWDFGDLATLADTSHLQNPNYTYNPAGTYTVQLIVTNSKGCVKTINKDILISDIPSLSLFPHDTAYCGLDSLQLTASGTGNFSWSPLTNIIGANTATPRVFPSTPTKYIVTLTNASGCINKDSLTVTPKLDLTNTAVASPANICAEDTLTLTGTSNYSSGISWQWNPAATVLNPTQAVTQAVPMVNTTYTLRTTWGAHCIATATVPVIVKALAIPNAGPDAFVCAGGQSTTQLNASGGNTYSWTPVTGLSNPNIANPIAAPTVPTYYVVAVGVNGCSKLKTDTVFVNVGTLPVISTLNDTLICNIDTLQLTTTGTGSFVWSPNYMISSTTVASPLVSPDVPTWYHVRLTDAIGCFSDDSVFVDVKDKVTLNAGPDTTICRTDGFKLPTTGDALHYIWTPNTYLSYDTLMRPFTRPLSSITYHVIGNIGKCQSDDYISIKVVPYPATNAGPDQIVCPGFPVQLNASGGSHYFWTPATFLTNRNISNPVAVNPTANIQYIVTVTDTLGCPKPVSDTVWAKVYPAVRADAGPSDTTVVEGEPLFLHASGGATYLWSPTTWLNDPNISNPVSLPLNNIKYVVEVTSLNGCRSADSINILLYKMDPDMYVPTAFTPNGNGVNDVLRPILLGMKSLIYFKVFNRFGEMVFSTTEIGKGWDGKIAGKGQDPGTFVWEAEGVTYKGVVKKKKGYAVLIRE